MTKNKIFLHLDINYFFAQVEEIINPSLKNKPIVICKNDLKSIISTSNYNARIYGIKSGQKLHDALKLKKDIVIIEPNHIQYQFFSNNFFNCIKKMFPYEVEYGSIDECYIDATNYLYKYQDSPIVLANFIYQKVLAKTKLKISIGIGNNKFLAKTANDISDKKTFYFELYKDQLKEKLYDKKISNIYMIGKKTAQYFESKNIITINDFLNYPRQNELKKELKSKYDMLFSFFTGNSSNQLDRRENDKSFSFSNTFTSVNDYDFLKSEIIKLSNELFNKMKIKNCYSKNFQISYRNNKKNVITRSYVSDKIIDIEEELSNMFLKLFNKYWEGDEMINQIRVIANKINEYTNNKKQEKLVINDNF